MTSAPSSDRAQHAEAIEAPRVDSTTFRQGWRVRTRLDALLAAGHIAAAVWQAAVEYRDAYERWQASGGGQEPGGGGLRVSGGAHGDLRLLGVMGYVTKLRAVEQAIGRLATALCIACVVEDRSWAWMGRQFHRNPETVRDWTADALRALAAAWPDGLEGRQSRETKTT